MIPLNSRWRFLSVLTMILLAGTIVLSACDTGPDEPAVVDDAAVETVDEDVVTDAEVDVEAQVEEEIDTEGETESETMTETETMTDTDVMTETDTIDIITTTRVLTETQVITESDVFTETEVQIGEDTETEADTDVEAATPVPEEESDTGATETDETQSMSAAGMEMAGVSGAEGALVSGFTLLDYDFQNRDGEVSGDLEDLLVDLGTGNILFSSIEYGGFLDLGDKDIVVPLSAFAWSANDELVLNFDEQTLEQFPDLGNDWPDINDPAWDDDVGNFWSNIGFDTGIDFDEASSAGVMWLSNMTGYGIGGFGANAGVVRDVLVDLSNSRVKYVLFDYGAGVGAEPLRVVPFQALNTENIATDGLMFDADVDPATIDQAPTYDQVLYADANIVSNDFIQEADTFWNDLGFDMD